MDSAKRPLVVGDSQISSKNMWESVYGSFCHLEFNSFQDVVHGVVAIAHRLQRKNEAVL